MTDRIELYQDKLHAESMEGLVHDENGYKYRLIDGVVMPPYVTPARFGLSRTIETRPEDVSYCSYPKSGSTWLSNVIFLILNDGEVPEDRTLRSCLHWMESSWPYPRSREEVDALPSPRIFKSHMPYHMALAGGPTNSTCKHVYIARNPKDVCVSYYHFESGKAWSGDYQPSWDEWFDLFLAGKVQRGCWFDHVLSWWEHRDCDNLLFMKFEDLKRDFEGQLEILIDFIGRDVSPQAKSRIIEGSSFERMKSQDFTMHREIPQLEEFFRKGKIGSWQEQFSDAQNEEFDRVYAKRMADSGLDFEFG